MTDRLERNKKNVLAFYDLMFNQCKTAEAFEKYAGDVYIQHNQSVADGAEPVIEHFKGMEEVYPGKRAHFVRVIAEAITWLCTCIRNGRGNAMGRASISSGSM